MQPINMHGKNVIDLFVMFLNGDRCLWERKCVGRKEIKTNVNEGKAQVS